MPSALRPAALGLWAYISGKALMPMLQLLHKQKFLKNDEVAAKVYIALCHVMEGMNIIMS